MRMQKFKTTQRLATKMLFRPDSMIEEVKISATTRQENKVSGAAHSMLH
jgi:hypothetical protein